ncbi:MAG: heavy-metal-associated domain-containing protein [Myxococcota bacterium]
MLGMTQEVFAVTGMTCGRCEARVTEALQALPGVARVRASASDDRVEVTLARGASISRDALATAIHDTGFHVQPQPS